MADVVDINPSYPCLHGRVAMNFEVNRFKTYQMWTNPVSVIMLAKYGFFSMGDEDRVQCFKCGARYSGWRRGDSVSEVHRRISPNCALNIRAEDRAGDSYPNIPIPVRNQQNIIVVPSSLETSSRLINKAGIQETGGGSFDISLDLARLGVCERPGPATRSVSPAGLIPRETDGSVPYTARPDQRIPLQPQFSTADRRLASFQNFPVNLRSLVKTLVQQGFFYTGHGDIVMCYHCGLTIKNWRRGNNYNNDPRLVHAQWRRDCAHFCAVEDPAFGQRAARETEVIGADGQ
ncbi:baculoviral IAP repeat-containing protein 7-B-like [Babylonia areolata]|uniref:baculoviral IAP repeat-containing protein 7-B-like n=1 Tax=Babylonia areolata TaxID=304850 RepID=UPI003FD4493A